MIVTFASIKKTYSSPSSDLEIDISDSSIDGTLKGFRFARLVGADLDSLVHRVK